MGSEKAPRHGGDSALLIPGWPLRRKVALAVAIPLLLAATFGALRARADLVTSENAETSASQVTVLRPAVRYLVEAERGLVAAHQDDPDELMVALANIARAADDLLYARDTSGLNPSQLYQVDVVLDLSQALRDDRATSLTTGTWQAQLRQLHSGITQLITTIVNAQINPEPGLELLSQAIGGRFSLAMEQALVATDRKGDTGSLELFAELGSEGVAIDRLASGLGEIEPAVFRLRTANGDRFRAVRIKGSDLGGTIAYADYDKVIALLLDDIDARLAATADDARTRALVNGGITLGALLAAILLALLVSRIILRPIRRVREGVLSVAHEQLPAAVALIREGKDPGRIVPIDVTTGEEIGQVARAVDDLHRQAVLLATGEAELRSQVGDMFVTLSRRSTALVNQQLSLIEALEKHEQDPKRLESLFRLDHLAARMRRTADSLLILADAPARSSGVGESLTVGEAMQAATAGVQEYQRVELGTLANIRVRPDAAADLVHVLTELVDNALTYSPPTSKVTVNATSSSDAVTVEITDSGLGMADDTLAELNETLHSGGELTPDTARRMGLFVVSRLAKKHGLAVALRPNFPAGTTAVVFLPPTVLLGEVAPRPQRVVAAPTTTRAVPEPAKPLLDLDANDIAARISGRLPVRQPGAALQSGNAPRPFDDNPAAAPLPVRRPAGQPVVEEPVAEEPVAEEAVVEDVVVEQPVEQPVVEQPVAEEHVFEEPVAEEPVAEPVAEEPVAEPVAEEPVAEEPVFAEPVAETPVAEAPAAKAYTVSLPPSDHEIDSLDAEWTSPSVEEEQDSPIFKAMRSAWLNSGGPSEPWTDNEVEEGWDRAEEVTQSVVGVTDAGLPQRRPGARLVPGGVATLDNRISRDPEEIRARLASHAAGVSRGRRAATPAPDDTEAGTA